MQKMTPPAAQTVCPHCGAPVLSEVCQYCGSRIDNVDTAQTSAEYPTLECKNASLSFFGTIFPLIFMLMFGFFGFLFPIFFVKAGEGTDVFLVCLPFAAVGIGAGFFFFRSIFRYFSVRSKGDIIDAVVYGYMDDTVSYNGNNGQVVKLLIDTRKGKRFIFYPLHATNRPYTVNSRIRIQVYKKYFRIVEAEVYEG